MDSRDPNSRTRVTKLLCMTSNPEEKRKTIGDVFVKVSLFMCDSHLCVIFSSLILFCFLMIYLFKSVIFIAT